MTAVVRVGLYARTSTAAQHVDAQLAQLRRVADQRGWAIAGEFVDAAVSSGRKRRPEFERMMTAARSGELDVVMATALDRFARSTTELINLGETLQQFGVDFVSLREAIETGTAVGRLIFTVLAALSQFEKELLRERTMVGLQAARRRGKTLGRPKAEVSGWDVRAARERGLTWSEVADQLGVSESTARRALRRLSKTCPSSSAEPSAKCPT